MAGHEKMEAIKPEGLPPLISQFDPIKWQATNPQHHLCIYKLNQDQLKEWGEEATEIRQKISRKAETYEFYSKPKTKVEEAPRSRKSVPHSTRKSNPEGLLES